MTQAQAAFAIKLVCESLTDQDQRLLRNALDTGEALGRASGDFLDMGGRERSEGVTG